MNKDDYAKRIARKSIVEKFIDKLDKVSMEDTELLPALIRFVENGDEREFKEFRDYQKPKKVYYHWMPFVKTLPNCSTYNSGFLDIYCDSHEEAIEAALKYTLENLL